MISNVNIMFSMQPEADIDINQDIFKSILEVSNIFSI